MSYYIMNTILRVALLRWPNHVINYHERSFLDPNVNMDTAILSILILCISCICYAKPPNIVVFLADE